MTEMILTNVQEGPNYATRVSRMERYEGAVGGNTAGLSMREGNTSEEGLADGPDDNIERAADGGDCVPEACNSDFLAGIVVPPIGTELSAGIARMPSALAATKSKSREVFDSIDTI